MQASFVTLFIGATAQCPEAPLAVGSFIQFRRHFGEGITDHTGPPGTLARGVWAYFRVGGERALVVSTGHNPLPRSPSPEQLQHVASAMEMGLGRESAPFVVLPDLGDDPDVLLQFAGLRVTWPDPAPAVLLDAPHSLAQDVRSLAELSGRLLSAGRGRYRLVAPSAQGTVPVMGPSRGGAVSVAALAAGLAASGSVTRVAGSGLSLPSCFSDADLQRLVAAGVIVLRPLGGGHLEGLGLPSRHRRESMTPADEDDSPQHPLVHYLSDELAHHAHTNWDPGLYRRVERDATAAVERFLGRGARGFHVRCDEELNPPSIREQGLVVLEVVLGPSLPVVKQVVIRVTLR